MSVKASTISRSEAIERPSVLYRTVIGRWANLRRHLDRRDAVANLRELDDRLLEDIGLARLQIEAAVRGSFTRPSWTAPSAASDARRGAVTAEMAAWS